MIKYKFKNDDKDDLALSSNEKHDMTNYKLSDFVISNYASLETQNEEDNYFLSKTGLFAKFGNRKGSLVASNYKYFDNNKETEKAVIEFIRKNSHTRRYRNKRK